VIRRPLFIIARIIELDGVYELLDRRESRFVLQHWRVALIRDIEALHARVPFLHRLYRFSGEQV
jgi:hypothetical protein